ncbi:MAG: sugar transferase [Candidatus Riflebacteria bacterium]|nr:sugar transferase [Candidatus Riflebacteria bacterium]
MQDNIKRCFDVVFSLLGLVFLSPIFFFVAMLIKLKSKGSVFFIQERIGKNFKPIKIIKFRTMTEKGFNEKIPINAENAQRITRIGGYLRKYKIDELPQLLGILFGDMSFVGPRPELAKYVNCFYKDYKEILQVKPGITDFAAIEYRNEEELLRQFPNQEEAYIQEIMPKKILMYKKYISSRGFFTDISLIFRTLFALIKI